MMFSERQETLYVLRSLKNCRNIDAALRCCWLCSSVTLTSQVRKERASGPSAPVAATCNTTLSNCSIIIILIYYIHKNR
jgi:hypothetical protein